MENVELTPEQKKEKAAQAKKEAAEKAKLAKEQKDQQKADEKAQAEANKLAEANEKVTAEFTTLKGHTDNGTASLASLTEESTVDQVNTAGENAGASLKAARESLKLIKATVKKLKEPGELAAAVTSAEGLVSSLDEALKGVKGKVAAAKKAAKEAEKAEAKRLKDEAKAANAMPNQNGITRPRPDTACGNAWALMDELSAKLSQPAPISIVLQGAEQRGLNYDTVKTQYARWKKFNGIEGRVAIPLPQGLLD
jgi:hypothetical protein